MTPTTIDATDDVVTLVDVFMVTEETQQQLVELLGRAAEEVMRHRPGFVSANIHAGLDGTLRGRPAAVPGGLDASRLTKRRLRRPGSGGLVAHAASGDEDVDADQ